MSNMSYCRFRNTLSDLRDCQEALSEMEDQMEIRERIERAKCELSGLEDQEEELTEEEQDTVDDLEDQIQRDTDDLLADGEEEAMRQLIDLCYDIAMEHHPDA